MKLLLKIQLLKQQKIIFAVGAFIFIISSLSLNAQANASALQDLSFGSFYTGASGGTVTVPSVGSRTATGSVVLFAVDPGYPAIIQVTVYVNHVLTFSAGSIVNLSDGSGNSMVLEINDFYPSSPFTPTDKIIEIKVGGKITVGAPASSPAGNYSGSFEITFNAQ